MFNGPMAVDDKAYFLQISAPSIFFCNNGEKWGVFLKSAILWHILFAFPTEEALGYTYIYKGKEIRASRIKNKASASLIAAH